MTAAMTPEERTQATAFVRALGELVNEGTEDAVSKASEWAERIQALAGDAPIFRLEGSAVAGVVVSPRKIMCQLNDCDLMPDEALALARWILDTFGEPAP